MIPLKGETHPSLLLKTRLGFQEPALSLRPAGKRSASPTATFAAREDRRYLLRALGGQKCLEIACRLLRVGLFGGKPQLRSLRR